MEKEKKMSFDERRKQEEKKLWEALAELSDNKKKVVEKTVIDAAFKSVQLEDLHAVIEAEGVVEEYQNGSNQSGRKVSSNVQVYNSMDKSYQSQVKILLDALPKDVIKDDDDGFDEFVTDK
ncbi:hypothetical protein BHU24_05310 [Bacillus pseudomycoides]|uniref:hypothetical protein n=1 Tax=Bacillus pseudomycoides TaxID=64104 RepID=UPI001785ADDD|nr:hypothetical protein [Bacillus pseudomycoides]MBD5798413.1 hypothetical protein [Bacillus pseudomycoides]